MAEDTRVGITVSAKVNEYLQGFDQMLSSTKKVTAELNTLAKSMNSISDTVNKAAKASKVFTESQKKTTDATKKTTDAVSRSSKGMDTYNEKTKSASSSTNIFKKNMISLAIQFSLIDRALSLAISVVKKFVTSIIDLTKASVRLNLEYEAMEVRLQGLLGSTGAAKSALEDFRRVAASTEFSIKDVSAAGVSLASFMGETRQNVTNLIKPLSDLASFMGITMTDAASAMGRAFAGGAGAADILRERGVLELVKSFTGVRDLTKFTLPEFKQALISTMVDTAGPIAGATDRMANRAVGAISNMKDAWDEFTRAISENALEGLQILAKTITDVFQEAAKGITGSDSLNEAFKTLAENINKNKESILEFLERSATAIGTISNIIANLPIEKFGKFIEGMAVLAASGAGAKAGFAAGTALAPFLGPAAPAGPVGGAVVGGLAGGGAALIFQHKMRNILDDAVSKTKADSAAKIASKVDTPGPKSAEDFVKEFQSRAAASFTPQSGATPSQTVKAFKISEFLAEAAGRLEFVNTAQTGDTSESNFLRSRQQNVAIETAQQNALVLQDPNTPLGQLNRIFGAKDFTKAVESLKTVFSQISSGVGSGRLTRPQGISEMESLLANDRTQQVLASDPKSKLALEDKLGVVRMTLAREIAAIERKSLSERASGERKLASDIRNQALFNIRITVEQLNKGRISEEEALKRIKSFGSSMFLSAEDNMNIIMTTVDIQEKSLGRRADQEKDILSAKNDLIKKEEAAFKRMQSERKQFRLPQVRSQLDAVPFSERMSETQSFFDINDTALLSSAGLSGMDLSRVEAQRIVTGSQTSVTRDQFGSSGDPFARQNLEMQLFGQSEALSDAGVGGAAKSFSEDMLRNLDTTTFDELASAVQANQRIIDSATDAREKSAKDQDAADAKLAKAAEDLEKAFTKAKDGLLAGFRAAFIGSAAASLLGSNSRLGGSLNAAFSQAQSANKAGLLDFSKAGGKRGDAINSAAGIGGQFLTSIGQGQEGAGGAAMRVGGMAAQGGAAFGPWGAAIGAGLGVLSEVLGRLPSLMDIALTKGAAAMGDAIQHNAASAFADRVDPLEELINPLLDAAAKAATDALIGVPLAPGGVGRDALEERLAELIDLGKNRNEREEDNLKEVIRQLELLNTRDENAAFKARNDAIPINPADGLLVGGGFKGLDEIAKARGNGTLKGGLNVSTISGAFQDTLANGFIRIANVLDDIKVIMVDFLGAAGGGGDAAMANGMVLEGDVVINIEEIGDVAQFIDDIEEELQNRFAAAAADNA